MKPEQIEQIKVVEWVKQNTNLKLIYIPNDGKRSPTLGRILKRMGLYPGTSDIFMPQSNGKHHGLWIELKVHPNKPTKLQLSFLDDMHSLGYGCAIAYGAEEAIDCIKAFYGPP